jgi:hypothetical protein
MRGLAAPQPMMRSDATEIEEAVFKSLLRFEARVSGKQRFVEENQEHKPLDDAHLQLNKLSGTDTLPSS